jgi:hypothetical protein
MIGSFPCFGVETWTDSFMSTDEIISMVAQLRTSALLSAEAADEMDGVNSDEAASCRGDAAWKRRTADALERLTSDLSQSRKVSDGLFEAGEQLCQKIDKLQSDLAKATGERNLAAENFSYLGDELLACFGADGRTGWNMERLNALRGSVALWKKEA